MVDLSTLDGASLVPQFGGIQKRLDLQIQEEKEQAEVERLISAPNEKAERSSLLRLSQLDPAVSASVQGVLKRRDNQEIAALQNQADQAFKFSTLLGGIKDFNQQNQQIESRIAELRGQPGQEARVAQLTKLRLMRPKDRELAILKTKTMATDVKSVAAAEKARIALEKENQEKKFLQNALTAQQIQAAPVGNQAPLLEEQAFREEQKGNSQGAQVWRQIAGMEPGPSRDQAFNAIQNLATTKLTPVVPAKPQTEAGKINLDESTGAITSEQATQQRQALKDKTKTTLLKNLQAIGIDPNTPEGAQLVKDAILKPRIVIKENEGLFKLPQGFMLADPNDPAKGVVPIPGGPKDNLSGESAGKAQMLRTAQKAAKGLPNFVFKLDKDGKPTKEVDTANLINAQLNTPGTVGRELRQKMEFGIQAITRIETGAAMPAEELNNTRARFMPTPLDSDKIVNLKLQMFDDFIGGALKLLDPTGRFNDERFQSELEERAGGAGAGGAAPPATEPQAVDTGQKTPEGLVIFKRPNGSTFAVQP